MTKPPAADSRASLSSVDRILRAPAVATLTDRHGRQSVVAAVRDVLDDLRAANAGANDAEIAERCRVRLAAHMRPVAAPRLHSRVRCCTPIWPRAMPEEGRGSDRAALRDPTNLEYDLETGNRGDRTDHGAAG